jgi:enoyl-CoA hydratase/carnithine racemase
MTEELLFEIRDRIGFVTLNRLAARNALTGSARRMRT